VIYRRRQTETDRQTRQIRRHRDDGRQTTALARRGVPGRYSEQYSSSSSNRV